MTLSCFNKLDVILRCRRACDGLEGCAAIPFYDSRCQPVDDDAGIAPPAHFSIAALRIGINRTVSLLMRSASAYRDARCGHMFNSARHCRAVDLRSSSSIGNSTQIASSPDALDADDGRASKSKYTRSMGRFMFRRALNSRSGSIKPQVVGNRSVSTGASIQDASRSASP
jgi:hypothetical protein